MFFFSTVGNSRQDNETLDLVRALLLHEHETYPYVPVVFVRNGNMDVRYNGKNYLIGKGDVLLIDCVNPHYYRAHDGLEFLYAHFDGVCSHEVTELIIRNNNSPVFRRKHNLKVGQELFDCVQFFSKGGITNIFQEAFHIERILYLLSCEAEEKITETSPMEKIITHIHENFTRTITVNELAKLAHSSKTVAEILRFGDRFYKNFQTQDKLRAERLQENADFPLNRRA